MALPLNVRDLMRAGSQLGEDRDKPIGLDIIVDVDAPESLLVALESALVARTARTDVRVGIAGAADEPAISDATDAVIVAVGSGGPALAASVAAARGRSVPCVALAVSGASTATAGTIQQPLDDFLEGDDAGELVRRDLARWIADHLPAKRLALAANYDVMRAAVADEYVRQTAWQNALIGGIVIIPGADMPLMTGNQAKMVLQIAAAYGQHMDAERAKELLAVVGGGLAFRAVARQLLDFVPGFGWALKAGIGYTGTIAIGKAAIAYFERGADIGQVIAEIEAEALVAAAKVLPEPERRRFGRRRRRGRPARALTAVPAASGSGDVVLPMGAAPERPAPQPGGAVDVPLPLEAPDEGAGA